LQCDDNQSIYPAQCRVCAISPHRGDPQTGREKPFCSRHEVPEPNLIFATSRQRLRKQGKSGDPKGIRTPVDAAVAHFGGLDVLVNNAGYGNVSSVEDTPLDDFRAQIETNLFGVIIMTKAVLPYFRERRAGYIIQVTSIAGRLGPLGRAPYAAAKFGVEGFSESLAKEIGPLGIKVTIVEPGGFRTDFAGSSTELREGRSEYESTVGATIRFQRDYNGKQPGDPAKAAAVLLHLASQQEPPLRLLLGSDSYNAAEKSALDKLESDRKWKDLTVSTDYSS
jgi:NAD(P)-dependent dehydrogenase (short-subunit alcohol dehydrogenase family)